MLDKSDVDMYADDSSVTTATKTVSEIEQNLTDDAGKVSQWYTDNHMAANTTKTKVMFIMTWQKKASLPENMRTLHIGMNGQYLENVSTDKLLGVKINHNLSWKEHINSIVRKVNGKLVLLRGIKGCLPLETHKMFSLAHILPHMDYCSTVWGNLPHMHSLQLAQK